jgi:hypothetical protein
VIAAALLGVLAVFAPDSLAAAAHEAVAGVPAAPAHAAAAAPDATAGTVRARRAAQRAGARRAARRSTKRSAGASRKRGADAKASTRGTRRSAARGVRARRAGATSVRARRTRATRATRVRAASPAPLLAIPGATLRGSRTAVDNAYDAAQRAGLAFTNSRHEVERAAAVGAYVRLGNGSNYTLKGVGVPYVRPATRDFLADFGARHRTACGEPMVVTSAMRPTTVRLRNSVEKTVHPTGMAVDLRAPRGTRCRDWMRRELLVLERDGLIDATEERRPVHFHVVVFRAP